MVPGIVSSLPLVGATFRGADTTLRRGISRGQCRSLSFWSQPSGSYGFFSHILNLVDSLHLYLSFSAGQVKRRTMGLSEISRVRITSLSRQAWVHDAGSSGLLTCDWNPRSASYHGMFPASYLSFPGARAWIAALTGSSPPVSDHGVSLHVRKQLDPAITWNAFGYCLVAVTKSSPPV
ncbi:uncharacterized protein EI97DRAFT_310799 [Westerdykella ornata]|uniref:Uncharacterized protein n=1 Tax=Westerdykella ornata TaxID=318751 RepID=A0A6A6JNA4_WESOR|nr:uncharacterized protein EI97DRAFT_310799 [Westerdykella ornata]KAF2277136.1 hypothetical protein EI97DRAFT_310799 [Westerdykella ornata]